jgi:hypothetical protein
MQADNLYGKRSQWTELPVYLKVACTLGIKYCHKYSVNANIYTYVQGSLDRESNPRPLAYGNTASI